MAAPGRPWPRDWGFPRQVPSRNCAWPSARSRRQVAASSLRGLADDGLVEAVDMPVGSVAVPAGTCPFTVDAPVMRQRWERLTFVHWSYEPAIVQRLLPPWLRADTFGGMALVGLVPFFMRVATGGGHQAPWVSNFCETNVRTYVLDP